MVFVLKLSTRKDSVHVRQENNKAMASACIKVNAADAMQHEILL